MTESTADSRSVAVFYASVFNQKTPDTKPSWSGDWHFRRERLLLLDRYLADRKPDIIVLQQVMAREGSPAESDLNILSTGSLTGYDWDRLEVAQYAETSEIEFHAVASGLPIQAVKLPPTVERYWKEDWGRVLLFVLELDKKEIPVFNVEVMPETGEDVFWADLYKIVVDVLTSGHYCPNRVIIAGRIPSNPASPVMADFLESLGLKDVSEGSCEHPSDCYTASPANEIFARTSPGRQGSEMDRILVHRSSEIQSEAIALNDPFDDQMFQKTYGLNKIWPSERYGWYANVRLHQCDNDEYLSP